MTMFTQRETRILDQARDIISRHYQRGVQLCSPNDVRRCVMVELAPLEHEEFGIILLDNQNQLLHREILFRGTLNSVSVHPREVIKRVSWLIYSRRQVLHVSLHMTCGAPSSLVYWSRAWISTPSANWQATATYPRQPAMTVVVRA